MGEGGPSPNFSHLTTEKAICYDDLMQLNAPHFRLLRVTCQGTPHPGAVLLMVVGGILVALALLLFWGNDNKERANRRP